ncbi:nuclease [Tilletia horrida]|nr:nuclease [Tilletia horrida]
MSGSLLHAGIFAGGLIVGAGSTIALLSNNKPSTSTSTSTSTGLPQPAFTPPPQPASAPAPEALGGSAAAIIPPPGALASLLLQSDILRPSGYPGPIADLLPHTVFLSSYDRRLRHPSWTAEHLTAASLLKPRPGTGSPGEGSGPDRSRSVFKEDERIPPAFRARLADYFRSGYDRGHMVPAADAKVSQHAMDETFLLTNMAPQVGAGFNRDYWAHTEDFVRRLTTSFADVYVFTVPLYLPRQDPDGKHRVTYEVIGNPPNVAVPTHFAKVILASGRPGRPALPPPPPPPPPAPTPAPPFTTTQAGPGSAALAGLGSPAQRLPPAPPLDPSYTGMAAFVIPNAVVPNDAPLRSFGVPVDAVERAAGLTFFPDHVKAKTKPLCNLVSCDIVVREFAAAASRSGSAPPPSPGAGPQR